MIAPRPGDRVRVTYEGVWQHGVEDDDHIERDEGVLKGCIKPAHKLASKWLCAIPDDATVEVLASPVYVNSNTTEYRERDIVRDAHGNTLFRTERGWRWCAFDGDGPRAPMEPLTLLVRDGQVVQP